MKGLELAKLYYEEYGKKMIENDFGDISPCIAVALTGSGSECYGYDDEISLDHDFEPGFCIFLPGTDLVDEKTEFRLERAYAALPKEFMGYKRKTISPVGGSRHGVFRAAEYYTDRIGCPDGVLSDGQWLSIPDHVLAEAVNGKVFRDDSGLITGVREKLMNMPRDIFLKKLSGSVLTMAQTGQYNYERCLLRGDLGAAQLTVIEYVNAAMRAVFLLNRSYMPYYKLRFRAMRELEKLSGLTGVFEYLISSGNDKESAKEKLAAIKTVSEVISDEISGQGIASLSGDNLEKLAYSINEAVENNDIRNMGVSQAF